MTLVLVDKMEQQPGCCLNCGGVPTDDEGSPLPAIELQGIDVNWGDSVYLCKECTSIIADIIGRVSQDDHDRLVAEHVALSREHTKLEKRFERLKTRAREIVRGEKAKKEVRA